MAVMTGKGKQVADEAFYRQLVDMDAIREGHFLFSSGKHGDVYVEKFNLLRQPAEASKICALFAESFADRDVDVVVGPTTGGILIAFDVARQMGLPAAYAERKTDGSLERAFKRGTTFEPGSRVLVVDDVLTTGGSVRETLAALEAHRVEVVGIGVMVDRTAGAVTFGDIPIVAALSRTFAAWEAAECPLCARGVPIEKPGSTNVRVGHP